MDLDITQLLTGSGSGVASALGAAWVTWKQMVKKIELLEVSHKEEIIHAKNARSARTKELKLEIKQTEERLQKEIEKTEQGWGKAVERIESDIKDLTGEIKELNLYLRNR